MPITGAGLVADIVSRGCIGEEVLDADRQWEEVAIMVNQVLVAAVVTAALRVRIVDVNPGAPSGSWGKVCISGALGDMT